METITEISTREAYVALFRALPLEEQQAIYEMISELLEDIEDVATLRERMDEPTDDYMEFRKTLFQEVKTDV